MYLTKLQASFSTRIDLLRAVGNLTFGAAEPGSTYDARAMVRLIVAGLRVDA